MAIFSMDIASNLDTAEDIKKVKSYLYQLNEQLRYMFANLDPDENYNDKAKLIYVETQDNISKLEIRADGIEATVSDQQGQISNLVIRANGIESTVADTRSGYNTTVEQLAKVLNITATTPEGSSTARITGETIELNTGKFTITSNNLTIDGDGNAKLEGDLDARQATFNGKVVVSKTETTPEGEEIRRSVTIDPETGKLTAENGAFSGELTAAKIYGADITSYCSIKCGDEFLLHASDNVQGDYELTIGEFTITKQHLYSREYTCLYGDPEASTMTHLELYSNGWIKADDIELKGNDWWGGWTIYETIRAMWDCMEANGWDPGDYWPED